MQETKGLVSVVIPAYNAGAFITDTIQSVLDQTYSNLEVIVVDDGSTDDTAQKVRSFSNVKLHGQRNAGVSVARNTGLEQANGEFIVFFDADDLMTPDFLEVRVRALNQEPSIGFVGGWVENFPVKSQPRRATAEELERDIHFFNINTATIPSNYVFRTAVIRKNGILFNPLLSSSADRYFLLQLARVTQGRSLSEEKGKLLYRISESSMSHHVTPKLINDYYKFYNELNREKLFPKEKRREIKTRYLFSIASSFSLIGKWGTCSKLLFRSFLTNPFMFIKLAVNRQARNTNF
jgi:glycosyltransferase involved in cell wall biosynthesis